MLYGTTREPDKDYHRQGVFQGGPNLSSHALIDFIRSPAAYSAKATGLIPPRDSDAYRAGRAAHCRILEGLDAYRSRYVFGGPINEKTGDYFGSNTKAFSAWRQEHEAVGKEVLTDTEDTLCEFLAAGVASNPDAMEYLQTGEAEAVARSRYCGIECQIKIDWLREDAIVDLKTCREIERFRFDFFDYRYPNQLSFYQKVFENFAGVRLPVYIIAVEKAAPYRAAFFSVAETTLDKAQLENEHAIEQLRECRRSNYWPTGCEGVQILQSQR